MGHAILRASGFIARLLFFRGFPRDRFCKPQLLAAELPILFVPLFDICNSDFFSRCSARARAAGERHAVVQSVNRKLRIRKCRFKQDHYADGEEYGFGAREHLGGIRARHWFQQHRVDGPAHNNRRQLHHAGGKIRAHGKRAVFRLCFVHQQRHERKRAIFGERHGSDCRRRGCNHTFQC